MSNKENVNDLSWHELNKVEFAKRLKGISTIKDVVAKGFYLNLLSDHQLMEVSNRLIELISKNGVAHELLNVINSELNRRHTEKLTHLRIKTGWIVAGISALISAIVSLGVKFIG